MADHLRIALMAALFVVPPSVQASTVATGTIQARARIDAPASIIANQNMILGNIRLRAARGNGPVTRRSDVSLVTNADSARASFIVAGQADQAISVAIPVTIALTSAEGTESLIVETLARMQTLTGSQSSLNVLNNQGLLLFSVHGEFLLSPKTSSGKYLGLLVATAQYN